MTKIDKLEIVKKTTVRYDASIRTSKIKKDSQKSQNKDLKISRADKDEKEKKMEKKKVHRAWYVLLGLCAAQFFTITSFYTTASLYFPYVTADLEVSVTSLAIYLTTSGLMMAFMTSVVSRKLSKINVRWLLIIGNIILAGCVFSMSFCTKVWHWYLISMVTGTCAACVQILTPMLTINNWFVEKVGFANGLFWVSNGLGGVVGSPLISNLLASMGWRATYRVSGLLALLGPLFIFLFVKFKPSDCGLKPYGYKEEDEGGNTAENATLYGPTEKEAMKTSVFPMTIVTVASLTLLGSFMSLLTSYASAIDMLTVAGILLSCYSLGNTCGKFILPTLVDKFNVAVTTSIACVSGIIAAALLILSAFVQSTPVLLFGGVLLGVAAACMSLIPLIVRGAYGTKDYAKLYSYHTITQTLVGCLAISVYSMIMETLGVTAAPVILMVFSGVAIIAVVAAINTSKKKFGYN